MISAKMFRLSGFMVSVNLLFYCLTFCGAAGASSLMCVNLFSQNRTITLAEIKNAMSEIDSNLQKPSNEYEIDFRDAYNAFFTPDIGFEGKKLGAVKQER